MNVRDEVLLTRGVAEALGRSYATTMNYIRHDGLPHRKLAGRIVVLRSELEEWASRPEIRDLLRRGDAMLRKTARPVGDRQQLEAMTA